MVGVYDHYSSTPNTHHPTPTTLLIHYLQLLTYTFLMYEFKDLSSKVSIHTTKTCLCTTLLKDFIVSTSLKNGHVVLLLEGSYLSTNTETLGK